MDDFAVDDRVRLVSGETAGREGWVIGNADRIITVRWDSGFPPVTTVFPKNLEPS